MRLHPLSNSTHVMTGRSISAWMQHIIRALCIASSIKPCDSNVGAQCSDTSCCGVNTPRWSMCTLCGFVEFV